MTRGRIWIEKSVIGWTASGGVYVDGEFPPSRYWFTVWRPARSWAESAGRKALIAKWRRARADRSPEGGNTDYWVELP